LQIYRYLNALTIGIWTEGYFEKVFMNKKDNYYDCKKVIVVVANFFQYRLNVSFYSIL